ncbi:MAG: hypothetical protein SF029_10260 [bacterium]|nr:hypothetical protein [bacterium]
MRNVVALFAAFFAGLWLNERLLRQREVARPIVVNVVAPPQPPVDMRDVREVIAELQHDIDHFDTKNSLMHHFCQVIWQSRDVILTQKQFHDMGESLIAIASRLSKWDRERQLRIEGLD